MVATSLWPRPGRRAVFAPRHSRAESRGAWLGSGTISTSRDLGTHARLRVTGHEAFGREPRAGHDRPCHPFDWPARARDDAHARGRDLLLERSGDHAADQDVHVHCREAKGPPDRVRWSERDDTPRDLAGVFDVDDHQLFGHVEDGRNLIPPQGNTKAHGLMSDRERAKEKPGCRAGIARTADRWERFGGRSAHGRRPSRRCKMRRLPPACLRCPPRFKGKARLDSIDCPYRPLASDLLLPLCSDRCRPPRASVDELAAPNQFGEATISGGH
jgi:hypothetical protein